MWWWRIKNRNMRSKRRRRSNGRIKNRWRSRLKDVHD